jgi:lipoprotein-anchoring transpeptidase ErfK/SrfK
VPVAPAADTLTPSITPTSPPEFHIGDLVSAKVNVNCRETAPSGTVKIVVLKNQQAYVIAEPVEIAANDVWFQLQVTDAATTQCFAATRYFNQISTGNPIPPTVAPTNTPTPTRTPSTTPTSSSTPTASTTPSKTPTRTATPTLTGNETATPFKNLQPSDLVSANVKVNCRVGPAAAATVVKVVQGGEQAVILASPQRADNYDWAQVQLLDAATTQCYIAAQYLTLMQPGYGIPPTITSTPTITLTPSLTPTLTGSETATPTFTPSNTPTVTLTPTITNTPTETLTPSVTPSWSVTPTPTYRDLHAGDLVKANTSINCRVSTSAQSDVSWILNTNDRAVVLTDPDLTGGYYWSKVRPLGRTVECYVAAQYLDLVQAGYGLSPTPSPTASGTVTAGPYNVGDIIKTTTSVNLRTDAGTNFPVVTTINSGVQGTVMPGFKNAGGLDWVQVQFPTASGWLAVKYTQKVTSSTPGGPFAAGTQVVVITTVNLRTAPGTSNPSLGQLASGMQGLALGVQAKVGTATWVQVEFAPGTGWVDASYLKKLSAVTPTTGPSASKVWVYLDCTANPERVIVQNNNLQSIKVISIGSTYQPASGEPYAVGDTLGTKVTLSYQSNSNASGSFKLTSKEMFTDSAGSQEGVVVKTSVGDVTANCPAVTIGEKWIEVNLTTQTLYVYRGSTIISSSLVSTGKPGFSTPTGTFKITAKFVSVTMAGCANGECWDTPAVPWDMLFREGGFYIHGAYWHHDFGKVRSHGCVNLPVPYAEWLYSWTPIGTRVWIHY